jgi:hypothetical protein
VAAENRIAVRPAGSQPGTVGMSEAGDGPKRTSRTHRRSLIMAASPSVRHRAARSTGRRSTTRSTRRKRSSAPGSTSGAPAPTIAKSGENGVTITSETEERAAAALDVFKEKLVKRNISLKSLDAGEPRPVRQDVQDRLQGRRGHRDRQGQGDQQEDPRRGPQGRAGADPGRPAARHRQEAGTTAGRQSRLLKA